MKFVMMAAALWLCLVEMGCQSSRSPKSSVSPSQAVPEAPAVTRHGAPLTGAPPVSLQSLVADPQPHEGKTVALEGPVRQACTRKGCWMELAAAAKGPGVRVRFKDYGFFVPTDAAGSMAQVEGQVSVAEISEEQAAHWASEGAQIARGADGKPREVQLIATGVELRRAKQAGADVQP